MKIIFLFIYSRFHKTTSIFKIKKKMLNNLLKFVIKNHNGSIKISHHTNFLNFP